VAAIRSGDPAGVLATVRATSGPVRYLLGGVFINQLGAFVQTFIVLYLTVHGFSLGQAGIALTAYSAGATLGTLLGGELTHRIGPRSTITGAMTASALVVGSVPWLSNPSMFIYLVAAVAVAGLATQCYRPAAAVLLSELVPDEHRVMSFSMMRIAMNTGAALGPLIAAGLILVDWNLLFWFDSVTALAYAMMARFLLPAATAPREAQAAEGDRRSAYAILVRDGRYLLYLTSVLLGAGVYVQYTAALPLKIASEGLPTALYSIVLAESSLILILLELKITTYVRHWPGHLVGAAGTALVGLGVAGYGVVTHSPVMIVLSTVVFVLGVMISGPTMFAYPATFPVAVRARYVGTQYAMFGLGSALGPTLGVLAWQGLANGAFLVFGLVNVVAAICALVGMRASRSRSEAAALA
jgi:predicted MFS family arabinose efflux permease